MTRLRTALVCLLLTHAALAAAASRGVGESLPDVDALFAQWDSPESAGCALGVYRDGEIEYSRGYGMADLERAVQITPQSLFDLGSTSKQFTAASIVLLAQQGKLKLDDDVRMHVPELPDYGTPITLRHLLNHTSGLRDYIDLLTLHGSSIDDVTTPADALELVVRQKALNFAPGSEYLYSNTGYFLLSLVVERITGGSLRDFVMAHILVPLGMEQSFVLGRYDDVVKGRALAYSKRADGSLRTDVSRWMQLGDGAVFSSIDELLHWDNQFYTARIGGAALTEQLQVPGRLADGTTLDYGHGLVIGKYRGQRSVHHGGAWGGYRAQLMRFPEQRFSVALLCNLGEISTTSLAHNVADIFLADVLDAAEGAVEAPAETVSAPAVQPSKPADPARNEISAFAGNWRDPESRAVRVFAMEADTLYFVHAGARYAVRARPDGDFEVVDGPSQITLRLEPALADAPRRMRWTLADGKARLLEQLPKVTLSPADLAFLVGRYHSDEIDAHQRIEAARDGIILHRRGAEPLALPAIGIDEFASGSLALRFQRDREGAVTGYELDVGRVRGLVFDRQADVGKSP